MDTLSNSISGHKDSVIATLEHITGSARGTTSSIDGDIVDAFTDSSGVLLMRPAGFENSNFNHIARLHRASDSYEMESINDSSLWVNGTITESTLLKHRDLVEFGDNGPLCRFNVYHDGIRLRKTVSEIFNDSVDYARVSRRPWPIRIRKLSTNTFSSLTHQTTKLFRWTVLGILVLLFLTTMYQIQSARQLLNSLENDGRRLDEFSLVLARTQSEALRSSDLVDLRSELDANIATAAERLSALERRSGASARVITTAASSVVFLQGAYGYREIKTGRMLRHAVDKDGTPLISINSQPLLTLEGNGQVAAREFAGTAFVLTSTGTLLTNRHVALPWESDTRIESMQKLGMEPVMTKFIGYLPNIESPFNVTLTQASDEADLALLRCDGITATIPKLSLSLKDPSLGDEVIVMGYPTGLRSMIAQTGSEFIDKLNDDEDVDFWEIGKRLAAGKFIHPLASRGIVANVSSATIVYDAETTHGGSGGPVLNIEGKVVAINAAIIPNYAGSNLGVPR